jgi:hypothetical protein
MPRPIEACGLKSNLLFLSINCEFMLRALTIMFTFVSTLPYAQPGPLKIDTLWIHKAAPNDEDMDSYFPIVKSENPAVANNINTALQMQALGYILTSEKKATLLNQPVNPFERTNRSFTWKPMTARFLYVDILVWHFNNTMSLNGWNQINRYYFDPTTGQPVTMREVLFNSQTLVSQTGVTESGFMSDMVEVMKKYNSDFKPQDLAALEKDCQCNCGMAIKNAYLENKVRLDYNEGMKMFQFSMDDCDWINPRAHDIYETKSGKGVTDPWLTPYGRFLIYGGTPVTNDTYFKMWKGMIDGKISITFLLWGDNAKATEGHGLEIYDRHGVSIPLHIQITSDNALEMQELDNDGKVLATISSRLQGGSLVGKWFKADGSKTLPFTASPAK